MRDKSVMTFRPERQLLLRLRDAAKRSHRSVGAEVTYRLLQTFETGFDSFQPKEAHDPQQGAATP